MHHVLAASPLMMMLITDDNNNQACQDPAVWPRGKPNSGTKEPGLSRLWSMRSTSRLMLMFMLMLPRKGKKYHLVFATVLAPVSQLASLPPPPLPLHLRIIRPSHHDANLPILH